MEKKLKRKALFKTITWRVIASCATFILALIFFNGSPSATQKALWIAGLEIIIKMALYYVHERMWQKYKPIRKSIKPDKEIPHTSINGEQYKDSPTARRIIFVENNQELIKKAKKEKGFQAGKAGSYTLELIQKARTEIGYSSNISSTEIYNTLIRD